MADQRVKGVGFPINSCELGDKVPRRDAQIYAGMRDTIIKAHCDHYSAGSGGHVCSGLITITAKHVTLQCPLCGDRRMTMAAPTPICARTHRGDEASSAPLAFLTGGE